MEEPTTTGGCVICTAKVKEKNSRDDDNVDLSVLFFLTDLLPKEFLVPLGARNGDIFKNKDATLTLVVLESLLKSKGSPSSWISFCDECSIIVNEARELRVQIDAFQAKLDGYRKLVLDLVEGTWVKKEGEDKNPTDIDLSKLNQLEIPDRVRTAVIISKKKKADKEAGQNESGCLPGNEYLPVVIKAEAESDLENDDFLADVMIFPSKEGLDLETPPESKRAKKKPKKSKTVGVTTSKRASTTPTSSSTPKKKRCVKKPIKSLLDNIPEQDDMEIEREAEVDVKKELNQGDDDPTVIRTQSGRRVNKPDYKKLLMGVESDPEEGEMLRVKDERELLEVNYSDSGSEDDFVADPLSSGESSSSDSEAESKSSGDEENDDQFLPSGKKKDKRVRNRNTISCTQADCPRMFKTEEQRDKHFTNKHAPGWEENERLKKSGKKYPCEHCDKVYPRKKILKSHWLDAHGITPKKRGTYDGKKHVCEFCGEKYRNGNELAIHRRTHTGEKPFACEHCSESFISTLFRERHIEKFHWTVPPIKCDYCEKCFFRPHRLATHVVTHTKEKNYVCEICAQSFSQPTFLKYHQTTHPELNLESFKCTQCDKTFTNPTNLKNHHKAVHLKQYPISCEVCGLGFLQESHKRIHMRAHTGEKPFSCPMCPQTFRFKERLTIHVRSHTGERPFVCKTCGKDFASKRKLVRHEKIHGNAGGGGGAVQKNLQFRCEYCGKGCAELPHLASHKRYCKARPAHQMQEQAEPFDLGGSMGPGGRQQVGGNLL